MAAFAVVAIHAGAKGWHNGDVHTFDWDINNIWSSLLRWCVAIFCMISGALFLDNDKKIKVKDLYSKNILRIAIAFLVWSTGYALASAFIKKELDVVAIAKDIIAGHYHMWFMFMIIGFYAVVPIIRKITEDRNIAKYFIIISLISTFLIPQLLSFEALSEGSKIISKFKFELTLGYTPYFILGHYIHKYGVSKKLQYVIYTAGVLSFIGTTVATAVFSKNYGQPFDGFHESSTVNVLCQSLAVFLFAKNVLSKIKFSPKALKFIHILSKDTFGIYLVHVLVYELLYKLGFSATAFTPLLSLPLVSIVVFVLSGLISHLLNSIPVLKKYIV